MAKYALCKHGPHCRAHKRERCGFAHSIAEVTLPDEVWNRRFEDDSDKKGGLAGIDIWFGQRYSLAQHSRVCLYVECEGPPFPDWVRMYLWFHDKVRDVPSVYEEFNLLTRIREDLLVRMGKLANCRPGPHHSSGLRTSMIVHSLRSYSNIVRIVYRTKY